MVTVDGSGRYVLSGLDPGRYLLTAFAAGHKPSTSLDTLFIGGHGDLEQNFILQPDPGPKEDLTDRNRLHPQMAQEHAIARTVSVRVTNGSHALTNARLTVVSTGDPEVRTFHTDVSGGCTWTVNDTDRYVAWIEAPGHDVMYIGDRTGWYADQVRAKWSLILNPTLAGPWSISGSVIGSHPGSWIETTRGDGRMVSLAVTDSGGGYTLRGLTSGIYVLWFCQVGQPARMLGESTLERQNITQDAFSMR
jgi:hypothetical protein